MPECCPPGSHGYLAADHKDQGKITDAGGVQVYETGKLGSKLVLVMPDIWGWNSGRLRAIADELAGHGAFVVVPKVLPKHNGGTDDDGVSPEFDPATQLPELFPIFKSTWSIEQVVPNVKKVLAVYAAKGCTEFGVIGFCYGVWAGMGLVGQDDLPMKPVVGVGCHPSMHIGPDPAGQAKGSKCPWLLCPTGDVGAPGSDPAVYDADGGVMQALEEKFPGKNVSKRFSKQFHGFVTRGKITDDAQGEELKKDLKEVLELATSRFKTHGLF